MKVFEQDGIAAQRLEVTWDIAKKSPDIAKKFVELVPDAKKFVEGLRAQIPVQEVWGYGDFGTYIRPDFHARTICLRLSERKDDDSSGYIAIKGTEPVCENLDHFVSRMRTTQNFMHSHVGGVSYMRQPSTTLLTELERLPLLELNVPGALPIWDAVDEADAALELQSRHVARYGELARVPMPLFIHKWPDAITDRIISALKPHLAEKMMHLVHLGCGGGLGTYAYYYPNLPIRARHVEVQEAGPDLSYQKRIEMLSKVTDVEKTVNGWVETVARLLLLGFVGVDPLAYQRGYCVQDQNATLGGGLCDLNSTRSMDTFKNPMQLQHSIMATIRIMARTISVFLVGKQALSDAFTERFPDAYAYLWDDVKARIRRDAEAKEVKLHPVLHHMVYAEGALAQFEHKLSLLFGGAAWGIGAGIQKGI